MTRPVRLNLDREADYIAVLEQHVRHDAASTRGVLSLVVLVVIAVLLALIPLQARFGHNDFVPQELR